MSDSNILDKSMRSVFVGNIPYEATEEKLKDIFNEVGPVLSFKLVYDRETGKPKGYGFCEYKDQETALSAMRNLNGYEIGGRSLRVDNACTEKSRLEMQSLLAGPPVDNTYGDPVDADKAPEEISKAVASLPPEQMFELMKQMKLCIQNNPAEGKQMLLQNPQLAYALLQAQVVMRIVDPQVAVTMLHKANPSVGALLPNSEPARVAPAPAPVPAPVQPVPPPRPVEPPAPPPPPRVSAHPPTPNPHATQFMGQDMDMRALDPRANAIDPRSVGMDPRAAGIDPRAPSMDPRAGVMDPRASSMDPRAANMDPRSTSLDPRNVGMDPRGPGMDPRASTLDPRATSMDPRSGGMDSRPGGIDPRTGGMDPRSGGMDPRTGGMDPRAGGMDPRAGGMDPRAANAMDGRPPTMDPRAMDPRGNAMDPRPTTRGDQDLRIPPMPPMPSIHANFSSEHSTSAARDPRDRYTRDPRTGAVVGGSRVAPGPVAPPTRPIVTPQGFNPTIPSGATDQEKAALIMQVLQLSDDQIAMLPPEQRQSILVLKEQIAKSTQR